ncbi:MAG: hypothetical protein RLZZ618_273 [Pseudomonadota bacterium]|jgi:predicted MFS family arabinose efflux permease
MSAALPASETPSPLGSDTATLTVALGLALAAAVSLGLARFSYALLLPPMRADLGWSYFTAGSMNTLNAAGYLLGALLSPMWLRRFSPRQVLLAGGWSSAVLLALHGMVTNDAALYGLRGLTGVCSAASFVAGGLMAARLGSSGRLQAGLVLGLYYGGVGLGIIVSAGIVPPLALWPTSHAWQWAWLGLAGFAALATLCTARATRSLLEGASAQVAASPFAARPFAYALASYFMFGLGYIGYMTFVVTLLREQHMGTLQISVFYALLGVGVLGSSWLWAGLLQRHRGGLPMALLNALLAVASVLPVLGIHAMAVFVSGVLFGAVFTSVVASTTALVRHNLPAGAWAKGISAFTILFAAGQIVGPSLVGWLADGAGGLRVGLAVSAAVLACGALLAVGQKAMSVASAA